MSPGAALPGPRLAGRRYCPPNPLATVTSGPGGADRGRRADHRKGTRPGAGHRRQGRQAHRRRLRRRDHQRTARSPQEL